jgi:NADH:ubiquinone oxidoreductase subunit 2 (subunit N)
MYALLVIGALNTVISLVYYIKVLKVMALDRPVEDLEGGTPAPLRVPWGAALYSSLLAAAVLALGILPNWYPLLDYSQQGVSHFVSEPTEAILERPARSVR